MRAADIIARKRDGHELSSLEINHFITGYAQGEIPDYQAAAWLMAVYLRGMSRRETVDLTLAMANSGDTLDLSDILPVSVDKHSSGGVGDKTTLVVLPLVAACGVPVAKMSGRGLGFSGGTLDKLESIPGYRVMLTPEEFRDHGRRYGLVLAGQSANLAPADGKFYALRDVTATVPSLPLIASSIMSKKIAAGAKGIVLDVKVGIGAFMPTVPEAEALANTMVDIGRDAGRDVVALISDMNQPLGFAVGNALEVKESLEVLMGSGPEDLREHCLELAAQMIRLARAPHASDPLRMAHYKAEVTAHLADGSALAKFRTLVEAQGGDVRVIDNPDLLPAATLIKTIHATQSGYVSALSALAVGVASVELGAGRERKEDAIDHAVGILVHKKVGDRVSAGEVIFTIHANEPERLARAESRLSTALTVSDSPVDRLPMFYRIIG
jgi:pyrimidine-nucleoside phosphorylase